MSTILKIGPRDHGPARVSDGAEETAQPIARMAEVRRMSRGVKSLRFNVIDMHGIRRC